MSRCINKRKVNHQKATRRKHTLAKKGRVQKVVLDQPAGITQLMEGNLSAVVTEHQRQAKNSNPTANIRLSSKKIKKVMQRARITQDYVRLKPGSAV